MSNLSQFFGCGGGVAANFGRISKEVYVGPLSKTWTAPDTCTEVEFHVWGGGGYGSNFNGGGGGGGGGGYVRHIYPISGITTFSITVGGRGGTSSVSCTSQSPTSPISATGGNGTAGWSGGTGGDGSFTIAPGVSTSYTLKCKGGDGGKGTGTTTPLIIGGGGGGSAGSPYGDGIKGENGSGVGAGAGRGGSGGAIENIFGTGPWYFMYEFRSGNVSLVNTSPNQSGAFNGGAGRSYGSPDPNLVSNGSPGGICGGGGGSDSTVGGVGLVILYHN